MGFNYKIIKELREKMGLNQSEVASFIGVAEKTIGRIERGETTTIKDKNIKKMSELFSVPIEVFFENRLSENISKSLGNISVNPKKTSVSHQLVRETDVFTPQTLNGKMKNPIVNMGIIENAEQFEGLDKYDIVNIPFFVNGRVSAGFGQDFIDDEIEYLPYSKKMLQAQFNISNTGALGIIAAIGNSMNPTIQDGDLLLFQTDGTSLEGGIYIIRIEDDYFVKRIQKRPRIRLLSENPSYEPIEISDMQEINIIGRVVAILSSKRL